jgi:hypothetical protein
MIVREGEKELIAQLEKDLKDQPDIHNIYRILEGLKNFPTAPVVNKLISYVNVRE